MSQKQKLSTSGRAVGKFHLSSIFSLFLQIKTKQNKTKQKKFATGSKSSSKYVLSVQRHIWFSLVHLLPQFAFYVIVFY